MAVQPPHKPVHRTIKTALFAGVAMLACAAASGTAWAGPTTGTGTALLNNPSSGSNIGSGTYGTITLTPSSINTNEITVSVALVHDTSTNVLFINSGSSAQSHNVFGFNLDANTLNNAVISNISPGTFSALSFSNGPYKNTPFGTFDAAFQYTPTNPTGQGNGTSNGSPGPLVFTVTAPGITISNFVNNNAGYTFAADLSVTDLVANPNTTNTGIVAADSITTSGGGNPVGPSVPEPGSLVLLGTGLVGLGFVTRRKRHRA